MLYTSRMAKLIGLCLVGILIFTDAAFAAAPLHRARLNFRAMTPGKSPSTSKDERAALVFAQRLLASSSDYDSLFDKSKVYLRPNVAAFLAKKQKQSKVGKLPTFVFTNGNKILIKYGRSLIPLEIVSLRERTYVLNNKRFRLEPGDTPDVVWEQIYSVLPSNRRASWTQLVLPAAFAALSAEAQRYEDEASSTMATNVQQVLAQTIMTFDGIASSSMGCFDIKNILGACVDSRKGLDDIDSQSRTDMDRTTSKVHHAGALPSTPLTADEQKSFSEQIDSIRNYIASDSFQNAENCKEKTPLDACTKALMLKANELLITRPTEPFDTTKPNTGETNR